MRALVLMAAIGFAVAFTPRAAHACGSGGAGSGGGAALAVLGIAALTVGIADLGMGLYDLGALASGAPPSVGYGTVETLLAAPQLALGIAALNASGGSDKTFALVFTGWTAFMTAHGIYSIAAGLSGTQTPLPEPPPPPLDKPTISFGPTYVPLTNQPMPAFGLSGRF